MAHSEISAESHLINDELHLEFIAVLAIAWTAGQLRRYRNRNLNAGCWYVWDAVGPALTALLGQRQLWAEAIVFTAAFFTWTWLPGSPFDDFGLPSFGAFVKECSRRTAIAKPDPVNNRTAEASDDAPDCIICWSSAEASLHMPCRHHVCRDCLAELRDRRLPYCPLCRQPLFHINDSYQIVIHKAIAALYAADLVADLIGLVLLLCHREYWRSCICFIRCLVQLSFLGVLQERVAGYGVSWWRAGVFGYLLPLPVPNWAFLDSPWVAAGLVLVFANNLRIVLRWIGELDVAVYL